MEQLKKKHIITIAGKPGSGKSTTAKLVTAELGYQHFSSGDLFRAISKEQGLDVLQGNHAAERNTNTDKLVDQKLRDIGANEDEVVIDSRLAWHWMPLSYKVYLDLDLLTAAHRILGEHDVVRHGHEKVHEDPQEYAQDLQRRLESEARRYKNLYDINPFDMANYDLVVNTADNDINQVVELIITGFKKWYAR